MAGYMSAESLNDWNQHPLLTTIGSFDAPVIDLLFPAITICQEQFTPSNPWNLISNILNYASFDCSNNSSTSCSNSKFFEEQFSFLPELLYNRIDEATESLFEKSDADIQTEFEPITLTNSILSNITSIAKLKNSVLTDFYNYDQASNFFDKNIPATKEILNNTSCLNLTACKTIYKSTQMLIYKIETLLGKKDIKTALKNGDLLAKFAPLIGNSFSTSLVTPTLNCTQTFNKNEMELNHFFVLLTEKLFGKLNYTISIFDIPSMITSVMPGMRSTKSYFYLQYFPD